MYNDDTKFQDQTIRPRGMNDFARWYRPEGREDYGNKRPSDIDGMLHQGWGVQAWLMFEIKPVNKPLSRGQFIRLRDFSLLPNCISICVYEPKWNDCSDSVYSDDVEVEVESFRNGQSMGKRKSTVGALNARIAEWFDSKGNLRY